MTERRADGSVTLVGGSPTNTPTVLGSKAPPGGPSITSAGASPNPVDVGLSTALNVTAVGGSPPYTYQWSGLPPGCTAVDSASMACTPTTAGTYGVEVVVTDQANRTVATTISLGVVPPPSITSFTVAPFPLRVQETAVFSVVFSGGVNPYTFQYSGLPPGCISQNLSVLTCTPTSAGSFPVSVTLTDVNGVANASATTLVVEAAGPGPTISSFQVVPPNVTLGGSVSFITLVANGVAPLTYAYAGLPPGCSSGNAPVLSCTPGMVGTYTIAVTVIDGANQTNSSAASLTVVPVPPAPLTLTLFLAYPPAVTLGNFTVFGVLVSGGVGSLTYVYSGLPPGCLSLSFWIVPCRPAASGSYPVTVSISDSANHTVTGSVLLVVQGGPPATSGGTPSSGTTPLELAGYVALGVAVGVAATTVVVLLLRRRRRG